MVTQPYPKNLLSVDSSPPTASLQVSRLRHGLIWLLTRLPYTRLTSRWVDHLLLINEGGDR